MTLALLAHPATMPVAVFGLAVGAYHVSKKRQKQREMTINERKVYDQALATLKDPAKLLALSAAFKKEGFFTEATLLRKRAGIGKMSPEQKKAWRIAFKKGMNCKDPAKVEKLALAFDAEGGTDAAKKLRKYAKGLRSASA